MTIATNDHLIFDGLETITLRVKKPNIKYDGTAPSDITEYIVPRTLRRELELRQTLESQRGVSQGKVVVGDLFWEVYLIELPPDPDNGAQKLVVKRGMTIIPQNNPTEEWEILAVDLSTLRDRFRCHCRK